MCGPRFDGQGHQVEVCHRDDRQAQADQLADHAPTALEALTTISVWIVPWSVTTSWTRLLLRLIFSTFVFVKMRARGSWRRSPARS